MRSGSPKGNSSLSRGGQLAIAVVAAFVIAIIGSHWLADWTNIKTTVSESLVFGAPNGKPPAFRAGSSLSDYGIDWNVIATQTQTEILAWGVAGGSPYEFEQFQKKVPEARTTYIVVSAYDMDEANVSDFRAALVPLGDTIESLRETHADWAYSKRAVSQYPMTWLRILFPTLGRSRGVMGMIHEKIHSLVHHTPSPTETVSGPILDVGKEKVADNYRLQRIEDWSKSEMLGKVAAMRAGFQGSDAYDGQKYQAFLRMLQYGCEKGPTIVVVMPVSVSYSKEFVSPDQETQFENAMSDAQQRYPQVKWLRLDQSSGLDSDENFCDLVHMNVYGRRTATEKFQAWLKQAPPQS
jgi:hypothetical protein